MLQAGKDMLTELLGSKKFFIFLASLISSGLALAHWNVDPAVIDHYLELAGALILAQGVADHGKGAVQAQAKALAKGLPMPPLSKPPVAPVVATLLLAIGAGVVVHSQSGCGTTVGQDLKTGGSAFVDCGKQDLGQMVGDKTLLETVAVDLASQDYGDLIAKLLTTVTQDAVACAVKAVTTVATASRPATAEPTPVALHGQEMMKKYSWQFKPAGSK